MFPGFQDSMSFFPLAENYQCNLKNAAYLPKKYVAVSFE